MQVEITDSRPNLFGYATKELSQDAVICWLIAWAGVKQSKEPEDEALRRCGRAFVDALFAKWEKWEGYEVVLGDEISVEIHRQEKHIDILARIDRRYVLLIEDKTGTGAHGEQLKTYWHAVVDGETVLRKVDEKNLFPIFLKTGNQSTMEADRIDKQEEYAVFDRCDLLRVLGSYSGNDRILLDYRQYIQGLEDRTNSYVNWTAACEKYDPLAREGLYGRLEQDFLNPRSRHGQIERDYVRNRLFGGFAGVYWRPKAVSEEAAVWLQNTDKKIELVFRLTVRDKRRQRALLRRWHAAIMSVGGRRVAKPARMRPGLHMTVATWTGDTVAFGEDGRFDFPGTIRNLKKAERVLNAASRQLVAGSAT